jgi:glycosyltransferase involved in cell wall biosynthesis
VNGSGIFINNPLDPEEISARILEALEKQEHANDWKRRGLEHVQQFTWQKTIAAYDTVTQM